MNERTSLNTDNRTIYTIGHSVHHIDKFIAILQSFNIALLADVRRYPGSKRLPQFNKPALESALKQAGINYLHFPDLGGKLEAGSYTDHMNTDVFKHAIAMLQQVASIQAVAYMCAEADWRHCHRAKISECLTKENWKVLHITGITVYESHPGGALKQGELF